MLIVEDFYKDLVDTFKAYLTQGAKLLVLDWWNYRQFWDF